MIVKTKSNKSLGDTLQYNLKEESHIIGVYNLKGNSIVQYQKQMELTQELFEGRAKNLTGHTIISPSIEDGIKTKPETWLALIDSARKRLKIEDRQCIAWFHEDKEHRHLHLVWNRIDDQGKIYRNGNELRLSQNIGSALAREFNMVEAREVMREKKRLELEGLERNSKGSIQELKNYLKAQAEKQKENGQIYNAEKYLKGLELDGQKIKRYYHKTGELKGELKGYAIEKGGSYYPAFKIDRNLTLQSLSKSEGEKQQALRNRQEKAALKTQRAKIVYPKPKPRADDKVFKRYDHETGKDSEVRVPKKIHEEFHKEISYIKYENLDQFKNEMSKLTKKGIEFNEKKGIYSLSKEGHKMYAGEIDKNFTLGKLEKKREKELAPKKVKEVREKLEPKKIFEPKLSPVENEIEQQGPVINEKKEEQITVDKPKQEEILIVVPPEKKKEKMFQVNRFKNYKNEPEDRPERVRLELQNAYNSIKYESPEQLKVEMEKKGIQIEFEKDKQGVVRSKLIYEGQDYMASEIGAQYSIKNLEVKKEQDQAKKIELEKSKQIKPSLLSPLVAGQEQGKNQNKKVPDPTITKTPEQLKAQGEEIKKAQEKAIDKKPEQKQDFGLKM